MATALQSALARGFAALNDAAGESWAFGAVTFSGVLGQLRADDPRMAGATDRLQVLTVQASAFASAAARPRRGSRITCGSREYSVTRTDEQPSGLLEILVSPC